MLLTKVKTMEQENLITIDELRVIHSVLDRLNATGIEDVSGDWLSDLQLTDFSLLMQHLPEMAANTGDADLRKEIGYLSNLLYTIVMYKEELSQLSAFVSELNNSVYTFINLKNITKK